MIKLSDYLDYLNKEIIQARKKADEHAVKIAKEYAGHEYLKYFRVPRFSMPSIKIDIPLKISDIDCDYHYDLKYEPDELLKEVNDKICKYNLEKGTNIHQLDQEQLKGIKNLTNIIKKDYIPIKNLKKDMLRSELRKPIIKVLTANVFSTEDATSDSENNIISDIILESIESKYRLSNSKLNDLFIDPDTSKAKANDKLLVNLHVEMMEEGIKLARLKDANGNEIEEITFE